MSAASLQDGALRSNAGVSRLARVLLAFAVFCGGFVFIEPAPYEFAFALLCYVLLVKGLRIPALLGLPVIALALWICGGLFSTAANGGGTREIVYIGISAYLAVSMIVFAAIIAETPQRAAATIRAAWLAAAFVTASAGIIGYFHLLPGSGQFELYGRARGMFKDPNVFAPFLIFPVLLLLQDMLTGRARKLVTSGGLMLILLAGILLSLSRASWGHLILSTGIMAALMFLTSDTNRLRVRIVGAGLFGLCLAGALLAGLMAVPGVAEALMSRAELLQDYDAGAFGRFGAQIRALPELMRAPLGFGPYGFGALYGQDPHNVYLNAFASYGWPGGLSYLLLVLATLAAGLRSVLIRTPWRQFQIAAFAAYAGVALEGAVIDTDHWRHYFLLAGLVWGLAAASFEHRARAMRAAG